MHNQGLGASALETPVRREAHWTPSTQFMQHAHFHSNLLHLSRLQGVTLYIDMININVAI